MRLRILIPAAILAVAAAVVFAVAVGERSAADIVDTYCAYDARSEADWNRCTARVTREQIGELDTRAATCATLGGNSCRRGYGPFWARWHELRDRCSDAEHADPATCRGRAARYLPDR